MDLGVKNSAGGYVSLKQLHAHEDSKMLGVWVVPDRNKKNISNKKKLSGLEWGATFRAGNSSRQELCQALHSNIYSKLKYLFLRVHYLNRSVNQLYILPSR